MKKAELIWAEPKPKPWLPDPNKLAAAKYLVSHSCVALWVDPGFGKTSCVLAAFKVLLSKHLARRMLVIAPLRPCWLTWPAEQKKWEDFSGLRMVVLHGPEKERAALSNADIFVINPEGLDWLLNTRAFRTLDCDTLCVDESTGFKNISSLRFRLLKPVLGSFSRRWTLTGTPSPNGYMDIFGQVYVTDMGRSLGPYITAYRSRYFDPCGQEGMDWGLRKGAEQEIWTALRPTVFRLPVHDSVKVPRIALNYIPVELPPWVRNVYDAMEEFMIADLGLQRYVTALSAAASMTKCAQIAAGGVYLDPDDDTLHRLIGKKRDAAFLHDAKTDAVEELYDELGRKPLLVAYEYHHDLARLRKRFGKDTAVLGGKGTGSSGMRYDKELEREWNLGNVSPLLAQPQGVSHGLNLQMAANHVCWHSPTFNLELWDQFNRRLARPGNPHDTVYVHHIVAQRTVDEVKIESLSRKGALQSRLLAALTSYIERRRKA